MVVSGAKPLVIKVAEWRLTIFSTLKNNESSYVVTLHEEMCQNEHTPIKKLPDYFLFFLLEIPR